MSEATDKIAASLDRRALQEFGPVERMLMDLSLKACGLTEPPEPIGNLQGERVSGEMICPRCNQDYYHHPMDWRVIGYGDVPFLNILCDGTRVKL